ncbi:flavodoxin [Campylobacter sp.]
MTAVIFGSTMGNAEEAANKIAANLGIDTVLNIAETSADEINGFDKLIIGSSTWGSGDLQDDMDAFDFSELNLSGKTVALFGVGDSSSYDDTYCDALGILFDKCSELGANIVGATAAPSFDFTDSKASKDGGFVGLALDFDNYGDQVDEQIANWCDQIRANFS